MNELISKTDGPVFYEGMALLEKIQENDLEPETISPIDFLAADSNGNNQIDAADNFALGNPVLLREVSNYVSTYFPEFATDHLQLVPDNLGENAEDLAVLDDMGKEVSAKVEKEAAEKEAELISSIPSTGTVEELFGDPDSREGFKKRVAIIAIAPLDRSDNPRGETAKVAVTLKDHSTRTVIFNEYRTGTADTVFGETIEQAYGQFWVDVSQTYSFSDRSFFEAYQKMSRTNDEENTRQLIAGAEAGGVITAGLIANRSVNAYVKNKIMNELYQGFGVEESKWLFVRLGGRLLLRQEGLYSKSIWPEIERSRGIVRVPKGWYSTGGGWWPNSPSYQVSRSGEIKIIDSSLAMTSGQRTLSGLGRLAAWAGLAVLVYDIGSSAYSTLFPTPEEKLRQDIGGQLFRDNMTFGQFEGTIIDKPDLRKDLQIMAWRLHQQGGM